jgi:hypothetical protein
MVSPAVAGSLGLTREFDQNETTTFLDRKAIKNDALLQAVLKECQRIYELKQLITRLIGALRAEAHTLTAMNDHAQAIELYQNSGHELVRADATLEMAKIERDSGSLVSQCLHRIRQRSLERLRTDRQQGNE